MRSVRFRAFYTGFTFAFALAGCGNGSGGSGDKPPPEAMPGCNPVIGDDCLTPFPSSFYETVKGDGTAQVALDPRALPVANLARGPVPIKPDRMNRKDGFSPATPFIVYFKDGVSPADLPDQNHIGDSMLPASKVQLLDFASGERVPLFAEVDLNAQDGDRQALLIRPAVRLTPGHRYVVALIGLHDRAGMPLLPAPFRALRDHTPLSQSLMPLAARYDELFAKLEQAGIARSSLTLTWDVYIASDRTATGQVFDMVNESLNQVSATTTQQYQFDAAPTMNPNAKVYLSAKVMVDVPLYLADESGKSMLNFGPDGVPKSHGTYKVPVEVRVPKCYDDPARNPGHAPIPLVVFGHGLFQNAHDVIDTPELLDAANVMCSILIATDWIGLASFDLPNLAPVLGADLNNLYVITDRLQQAHVNAQVMTKLFRTAIAKDAMFTSPTTPGQSIYDGKSNYYFGVSNGGIQGVTYMTLSSDVVRGVLNVPGSVWSLLIFRSVDFNDIKPILAIPLPDPLDQQVAIALTQSEWDYTDPASFAPHALKDPLPDTPAKKLLLQESIGDAQVTNVSTRVLVRTLGVPAMKSLVQPVYGVEEKDGPLDSAYTQWDAHKLPLPPIGDIPPTMDNGAHNSIYVQPAAVRQIAAFLKPDGKVTQQCAGGVCSCPCN